MRDESPPASESSLAERRAARRWLRRYALLTLALCAPLLWAFVTLRNVYPVAASTMMIDSRLLPRGRTYFVLRGETLSGEVLDIPAIRLTNAMTSRSWGMVSAAAQNASFALASPHPENARLLAAAGALESLPRAARVPDLLRAWGAIYNARQSAAAPQRLRAIWLDVYRWEGGRYDDYDRFVERWRVEL